MNQTNPFLPPHGPKLTSSEIVHPCVGGENRRRARCPGCTKDRTSFRQPMTTLPGGTPCAACAGAHRKHTCCIRVRQPAEPEVPANVVAPLLLPVKKRLSATAPAADRSTAGEGSGQEQERMASGCAACAGGHRKHTCGKVLAPLTKARSESYCVACHGGHRKHTCKRRLTLGDECGSCTAGAAEEGGAGEDTALGKRRAGAESAASDCGGAGRAASETGCRACMGWHRAHTCGKSLRTAKDTD